MSLRPPAHIRRRNTQVQTTARYALQPTEDAEALFREVDKAFVGLDHLIKTGQDIQSLRQGHLRVIGPPFVSNSLLSEAAALFLDKYPDVAISIEARPHNEIIEMIALRQQDLGVAVLPIEHSAIDILNLWEYQAICVVPDAHPLAAQNIVHIHDLEGEAFISNAPGSQINLVTEQAFRNSGIQPKISINARTQEIACHMVSKAKGFAILSEPLPQHIRDYIGITIKPLSPHIPIKLGVLTSSLRPPPRMVKEFIDALTTVCEN